MNKLKESDLQIGDILIFENQDFKIETFLKFYKKSSESAAMYLLLYMIPWFDPGKDPKNYKNIYHAAIWGNVNIHRDDKEPIKNQNRIVQAGTHGIDQAALESTLKGFGVKNIYVYRFKEKDTEFERIINSQINSFYNDTSIPYSYETAWLLAVICSMRYSDGELHKILEEKLGAPLASFMTSFIRDMINVYSNENEKHMVACSTLVAMIYKNSNYPLKITDLVSNELKHSPILIDENIELPFTSNIEDNKLPKFKTEEVIITPRQLFESDSVEEIGYFSYLGK